MAIFLTLRGTHAVPGEGLPVGWTAWAGGAAISQISLEHFTLHFLSSQNGPEVLNMGTVDTSLVSQQCALMLKK